MKSYLTAIVAAVLLLFGSPAWSASTKEEVLALKAQVAEMQKDLAEIKKMLEEGAKAPAAPSQPGFKPQTVSIGTSPMKGDINAPVTIIEYSDYQCPFCARNYRDVLPLIQQEYIDSGKVRFVMRENPLTTIHRDAMNAAIAAHCAGDQGKYWDMHNIMFENQKQLAVDDLKTYAGTLGLDTARFNTCLDEKQHEKTVQRDMASGAKLGVRGTPAFVLGLTDPDDPDKAEMKVFIKGAQGIDQFRASINDLLESGN